MRNKYAILIFLFIGVFSFPQFVRNEVGKKELKIFIVHSYDDEHVCSKPQQSGFATTMNILSRTYNVNIKAFYLETNIKNTTKTSMQTISDFALREIEKFDPLYVYTTDDNAFRDVGIPASKKYSVVFSGINKSLEKYISEYPELKDRKIFGIEETINLSKVFKIFEKIKFIPDTFNIIMDDGSDTGYYMYQNYIQDLKMANMPISPPQKINSIQQFRKYLSDLNASDKVGVLVLIAQRMYDSETGQIVDKQRIVREITKYNKKHLELTANPLFSKLGTAMSCGPDFFSMGQDAASLLIEDLSQHRKVQLRESENKVAININRLQQLGFSKIISIDDNNLINITYGDGK